MSENSIMTIADFHISEMTAETAAAIELHNSIVSAMKEAAFALVSLCENLKRMRDTGQYKTLGFEKFEDYTEQACRIKKRQAYNYIATYERLGGTFLQSNAQLGITKLQLLTEVCAVDRADFVEQNDLDGMSVSEIKKLIAENKEYAEQISMFNENKEQIVQELRRLEDENEALKSRPVEVAVQEPSQEQIEKAVAAKTKELEKSYKDKLKTVKEKERQKAEAEKQKAIEEARTAAKARADAKYKEQIEQARIAAKVEADAKYKEQIEQARTAAKAEADAKYKEQIEQAEQDKAAALSKAKEIASKLDKNADRELVTASLYFSEAQTQFEKFLTAANKITDEKGAKIKKVAADFLKQYIDRLS